MKYRTLIRLIAKKSYIIIISFAASFLLLSFSYYLSFIHPTQFNSRGHYLLMALFVFLLVLFVVAFGIVFQRLRRDALYYRQIFNATGDGIRIIDARIDTDEGFKIIAANSRLAGLMNIPLDQQVGKKCYSVLPSQGCHTERCSIRRILNGEEKVERDVKRIIDEKEIWFHHVTTPLKDEQGDITAIVDVFRDITERVKMESMLAETNRELEKKLSELKSMQSELIQKEKLASIGQLAAGIAHEMNNPVGFVASNIESFRDYANVIKDLLRRYREVCSSVDVSFSDEKMKSLVREIKEIEEKEDVDFILEDMDSLISETMDGLNRLTEIIQGLREFSRVDKIGDFDEHDINEAIKKTLVITRNEYKYCADIELELGDIPKVYCNSSQINEVIMNTIVNAAHAVREKWKDKKGRIKIKTFADDNYVYYEIEDNGVGIPKDIRDKIFDPFFTTKEVGKGTGLGLNISYDIVVNKHKGSISVESEPGEWTRFTIKLPIKQDIIKENNEAA